MSIDKNSDNSSLNQPYRPRSFWKKVNSDGWVYLIVHGVAFVCFVGLLLHGTALLLFEDLSKGIVYQSEQLLIQHTFGLVALMLCAVLSMVQIIKELGRVNGSD